MSKEEGRKRGREGRKEDESSPSPWDRKSAAQSSRVSKPKLN